MSGTPKGPNRLAKIWTALGTAGAALSSVIDDITTLPPSHPAPETPQTRPLPPAREDYSSIHASAFVALVSTKPPATQLVEAQNFIRQHQNTISFEDIKVVTSVLNNKDSTPYSNEDALAFALPLITSRAAGLATEYTSTLRGTEKIENIAPLLDNQSIPTQAKEVIAAKLLATRKEDIVEFYAAQKDIDASSIANYSPELSRTIAQAVAAATPSPVMETSEAIILARAINYTNPSETAEYLGQATTKAKLKTSITTIIEERINAGKPVKYTDIETMLAIRNELGLTASNVASIAIRTFAPTETRAVAGAGAPDVEDRAKKFIEGLALTNDQAFELAKDESIPARYIPELLTHDGAGTPENAIEIGKVRTDLSFKQTKALLPEGTSWLKSDGEIFAELAENRSEATAEKLVENLSLKEISQYSKEEKLALSYAGKCMRAVTGVTQESLETAYIDLIAASDIGTLTGTEKFTAYKSCAAAIGVEEAKQFTMAAQVMFKDKTPTDQMQIGKEVCQQVEAITLDQKVELCALAGNLNFSQALEMSQIQERNKSEFFKKLATKYGNENPELFLGKSPLTSAESKTLALEQSPAISLGLRKILAEKALDEKEVKQPISTAERLKLERLKKGAALTKEEYFAHSLDHALIRNDGKEVTALLGNLNGKDRADKLRFIDALNAEHKGLNIKVEKKFTERASSVFRSLIPKRFKPSIETQQQLLLDDQREVSLLLHLTQSIAEIDREVSILTEPVSPLSIVGVPVAQNLTAFMRGDSAAAPAKSLQQLIADVQAAEIAAYTDPGATAASKTAMAALKASTLGRRIGAEIEEGLRGKMFLSPQDSISAIIHNSTTRVMLSQPIDSNGAVPTETRNELEDKKKVMAARLVTNNEKTLTRLDGLDAMSGGSTGLTQKDVLEQEAAKNMELLKTIDPEMHAALVQAKAEGRPLSEVAGEVMAERTATPEERATRSTKTERAIAEAETARIESFTRPPRNKALPAIDTFMTRKLMVDTASASLGISDTITNLIPRDQEQWQNFKTKYQSLLDEEAEPTIKPAPLLQWLNTEDTARNHLITVYKQDRAKLCEKFFYVEPTHENMHDIISIGSAAQKGHVIEETVDRITEAKKLYLTQKQQELDGARRAAIQEIERLEQAASPTASPTPPPRTSSVSTSTADHMRTTAREPVTPKKRSCITPQTDGVVSARSKIFL